MFLRSSKKSGRRSATIAVKLLSKYSLCLISQRSFVPDNDDDTADDPDTADDADTAAAADGLS